MAGRLLVVLLMDAGLAFAVAVSLRQVVECDRRSLRGGLLRSRTVLVLASVLPILLSGCVGLGSHGGPTVNFDAPPIPHGDGVQVANGPTNDATTVIVEVPIGRGDVVGQSESTWVSYSAGEPSSDYEVVVYPSTGPVGRFWLSIGRLAEDTATVAGFEPVDLPHATRGYVGSGPEITQVQWNFGAHSYGVSGSSATFTRERAMRSAVAFVEALARGSTVGRVVTSDSQLVPAQAGS